MIELLRAVTANFSGISIAMGKVSSDPAVSVLAEANWSRLIAPARDSASSIQHVFRPKKPLPLDGPVYPATAEIPFAIYTAPYHHPFIETERPLIDRRRAEFASVLARYQALGFAMDPFNVLLELCFLSPGKRAVDGSLFATDPTYPCVCDASLFSSVRIYDEEWGRMRDFFQITNDRKRFVFLPFESCLTLHPSDIFTIAHELAHLSEPKNDFAKVPEWREARADTLAYLVTGIVDGVFDTVYKEERYTRSLREVHAFSDHPEDYHNNSTVISNFLWKIAQISPQTALEIIISLDSNTQLETGELNFVDLPSYALKVRATLYLVIRTVRHQVHLLPPGRTRRKLEKILAQYCEDHVTAYLHQQRQKL